MKKNVYMQFNKTGARIFINPNNASELLKQPNVIYNPNLSDFPGIPLHELELVNGRIKHKFSPRIKSTFKLNAKNIIYLTNGFWIITTISLLFLLNK